MSKPFKDLRDKVMSDPQRAARVEAEAAETPVCVDLSLCGRLRGLATAATPGPWTAERDDGTRDFHGFAARATVRFGTVRAQYGFSDQDAEFVAAANPATILALLDVAEAAKDALGGCVLPDGRAAALRDALSRLDRQEQR